MFTVVGHPGLRGFDPSGWISWVSLFHTLFISGWAI